MRPHSVHVGAACATDESSNPQVEALVDQWLSLPEVAQMMQLPITRVRQLLADAAFVALRRGVNNALYAPAQLFAEGAPLAGLAGVLTVLTDGGFNAPECVGWLFTPEDSLGGTPVQALRAGRKTAVRRLAQASAW